MELALLAKKLLFIGKALSQPAIIAVCNLPSPLIIFPHADHHSSPGFQNQPPKSGTLTPKTVNSLAAIAGNEGDEEVWKFASYNVEEDEVI